MEDMWMESKVATKWNRCKWKAKLPQNGRDANGEQSCHKMEEMWMEGKKLPQNGRDVNGEQNCHKMEENTEMSGGENRCHNMEVMGLNLSMG